MDGRRTLADDTDTKTDFKSEDYSDAANFANWEDDDDGGNCANHKYEKNIENCADRAGNVSDTDYANVANTKTLPNVKEGAYLNKERSERMCSRL